MINGKTVIGIVGTRQRDSKTAYFLVEQAFNKYRNLYSNLSALICSGGCPKGADRFAEIIAKKYCLPLLIFPANWDRHKNLAGFIRNTDIANVSDVLIACVSKDRTGGTEDTIKKFTKLGKDHLILV
jgi:hypothetical protein